MSTSPTTVSEYDAIARTVQQYVDGGKSGRSADMQAAFHPDATCFDNYSPHSTCACNLPVVACFLSSSCLRSLMAHRSSRPAFGS